MTDSSAVKQEDACAAGGGSAATPVPGGSAAAMPTPAADTSPSPSTPSAGRTVLSRRATVGEVALSSSSTTPPQTPASSSASCHRWRPRSKSVSNACERCRRRKIRCDGDSQSGPCSTCVRFCVACVRPPRPRDHRHGGLGAHRALASRIQYLEAQLAEMGDVSHAHAGAAAAHSHSNAGWPPDDSSWLHVVSPATATIATTTTTTTPRPRPAQPLPPSLHLDTTVFGIVPQQQQQRRSLSWDSGAGVLGGALGSSSSSNAIHGDGGANPVPAIPTIEISECVDDDDDDGGVGAGGSGDHLSPPSALLSPAPSLVLSANSRASTPEPHAVTTPTLGSSSTLAPPLFGSPVSPPVSACPLSRQPPPGGLWGEGFPLLNHGGDGNDDFLSPLSPRDNGRGKMGAWSRRSSVSSLGLDHDFCSIDLQFSGSDDEGPLQAAAAPPPSPGGSMASVSYFPQHHQPPHRPRNSSFLETATATGLLPPAAAAGAAAAARNVPTKFEAETLADIVFAQVPPAHLPIDRTFHQTCLDLVYNEGGDDDASGFLEILLAPYSQRMARFYVYMATALGMRLRICSGGGGGHVRPADQKLLESAYGLAMEEAAADPGFWVEVGGVEAARLVELFARTGDGGLGDAGDLQWQREECSDMMDY